jgi:hypothetical protein
MVAMITKPSIRTQVMPGHMIRGMIPLKGGSRRS